MRVCCDRPAWLIDKITCIRERTTKRERMRLIKDTLLCLSILTVLLLLCVHSTLHRDTHASRSLPRFIPVSCRSIPRNGLVTSFSCATFPSACFCPSLLIINGKILSSIPCSPRSLEQTLSLLSSRTGVETWAAFLELAVRI
jgi:hypothetical protein